MQRRVAIAAGAFALSLAAGCATFEHAPKDYAGPAATLRDFAFSEDRSKARVFAVMEIDGNAVRNTFGSSAAASHGQGSNLTVVVAERRVKAVPMKVKLRGSHATGAPIHAIASQLAGTFFSVEGVVDFRPEPDGFYVVKGELGKERSSVWIEDATTGKRVTEAITR